MPTAATPSPKLIYKQHEQTAQFFNEPLAEGLALKMMLIPGGTFLMGSPPEELERSENEGPQRKVTVPSFCMGKYPVTQEQWRFIAGLTPIDRKLEKDPSHFKGDHYPVEQVSWHDAEEFCNRLSRYAGRQYGLPSEAEWEYACRAGTITPFHFGETIMTDLANYCGVDREEYKWSGSYGLGSKGEHRETTTPVGKFGPNAFGLCDMHGNVWERCDDHWYDNYKKAPTDGQPWIDKNAENTGVKVLRGGSWDNNPQHCRSAYRSDSDADGTSRFIGFRVACAVPNPGETES
jgi:formylglycine-generating enzyme required for sulfatase activity